MRSLANFGVVRSRRFGNENTAANDFAAVHGVSVER
jgi:hypothetical protein